MNLFVSPTSTIMGDMFYLNPNVGICQTFSRQYDYMRVTVHFVLKDINRKNQSRALNIVAIIQPRMAT